MHRRLALFVVATFSLTANVLWSQTTAPIAGPAAPARLPETGSAARGPVPSPGKELSLGVAARVELGALDPSLQNNAMRWCQQVVAGDGSLLVFYADAKRQVVYRRSADGRAFEEPVVVAPGACPAAAIDESDNVHLAYRSGDRIVVKKLPAAGAGRWDVSGKPTNVSGQFGDGAAQFPSLLILPSSRRIWCMYGYVPSDLPHKPNVGDARKPKAHPVVTYSDDGGASWAPPRFVGSDSGDTGSGLMALLPYRGQPAWFWTFWDCASPAWGFFDGSRFRGMREFFPHVKNRMAVGHPWDAFEDDAGRLYFATGMHTPGQVLRVFDGSTWSEETWLTNRRGAVALLTDGSTVFYATAEGRRMDLFQLRGEQASPRPELYSAPAGRTIQRPMTLHGDRRPGGYIPLLLVEGTPKGQGGKVGIEDLSLTFLRLEVKPLDAAASRPASSPAATVRPLPLQDNRVEPRTDAPKDRKIVRVGERWVVVYAEDNPGRLMAAEIVAGKCGPSVALTDKPGWNAWQCTAEADGDDALTVVAPDARGLLSHRLSGIKEWGKAPPKAETRHVPLPAYARPVVLTVGGKPMLLVGGQDGLWQLDGDKAQPVVKEPWIGQHFSAVADGDRADVIYTPADSYLGKRLIGHARFESGSWKLLPPMDEGHVVEGLSLCSLGEGRLLAAYAVRSDRPETAPEQQERLRRFTYVLWQRTFDGKTWSAARKIDVPEIPKYRPANWKDFNENGGVIYIPEGELGRYPTLPASAPPGTKAVPVAWMVPGFHCMPKKERSDIDRGGLLVTTEIKP